MTIYLFFLGESIFFLKLNDGSSESTILMPLKKINYSCFLDQNIKITNLKEATLFKSSTSPQQVGFIYLAGILRDKTMNDFNINDDEQNYLLCKFW